MCVLRVCACGRRTECTVPLSSCNSCTNNNKTTATKYLCNMQVSRSVGLKISLIRIVVFAAASSDCPYSCFQNFSCRCRCCLCLLQCVQRWRAVVGILVYTKWRSSCRCCNCNNNNQHLLRRLCLMHKNGKWWRDRYVCVCLLLQLQLCNLHKTLFCIKRSYAVLLLACRRLHSQYNNTFVYIYTYEHMCSYIHIHTYLCRYSI